MPYEYSLIRAIDPFASTFCSFVFSFFRSPASLLSSPLSLFQKSVDIAHLLVALACAYDLCCVAFMLISYGE